MYNVLQFIGKTKKKRGVSTGTRQNTSRAIDSW